MKNQSKIISFIVETIQRLFKLKSPKYFSVVRAIGIVATFIGYIPDICEQLEVSIPQNKYLELLFKVAGITVIIVTQLSVENASKVVAKTDKLPFTEVTANPTANIEQKPKI